MPAPSVYAALMALDENNSLGQLKAVYALSDGARASFSPVDAFLRSGEVNGRNRCLYHRISHWSQARHCLDDFKTANGLGGADLVLFNAEGWIEYMLTETGDRLRLLMAEQLPLPFEIFYDLKGSYPRRQMLWLNVTGRKPDDERYRKVVRYLSGMGDAISIASDDGDGPLMYTMRVLGEVASASLPSKKSRDWITPSETAVFRAVYEYLAAPWTKGFQTKIQAMADEPGSIAVPNLSEVK